MEDNNNLNRPHKGLYQDSSNIDQPKDTYRFALNAVKETEFGDNNFLSNAESNELCTQITSGFIPLGKIYINENQVVILSASENENISEIGILNNNCNYTVHVNDENSSDEDKLNFKVTHQIQGIYRLRLGCERTIYFTDYLNRPRYYNFDSPEDFKNNNGTWNGSLFNLQKSYSKLPIFESVEVLDSGGNIEPGSYNVAIQYVDESLNPTEWITTSKIIKIYNELSISKFREIHGSINSDTDYENYPVTSKAIQVNLSNLDSDFLYYRLAFIASNNSSGLINEVRYTDVIPTSKDFFIYTGTNVVSEGTAEEIAQFSDIIYRAGSIEQIENTLLLGRTQGKQINFCKLQKYASKIKADCITKQVILNDLNDSSNPKNPTHEFGGRGYMPGEIYSFGIVYIFADGSTSPVYHIPGKNPDVNSSMVFSPGDNTYPMSLENQNASTYTDNDSCNDNDYWGRDSEGVPLDGKSVRHHRFPLRSEINLPLVTDEVGTEQNFQFYNILLTISGNLITPLQCEEGDTGCTPIETTDFEIRVNYTVDGQDYSFSENVNPDFYADGQGTVYNLNLEENSQFHGSNNIVVTSIEIQDINGDFQTISTGSPNTTYNNEHGTYFQGSANFTTEVGQFNSTVQDKIITTEILGIKFSGVDMPTLEDTDGEPVIGYYIVRNERSEFDKTILDSAVLTPSVTNSKYISHGLLQPETENISDTVYGVIHPEHKFNDREYFVYDEIIQQGNFDVTERKYGKLYYNDVFDGSSYNSSRHKSGNDDGHDPDGLPRSRGFDGWSLDIISRDNIVSYKRKTDFSFTNDDIEERFYLDALESRSINDEANDVYNISTDNKVGMLHLKDNVTIPVDNNLPYVVFKKQNLDVYSNFRVLPYYKDTLNPCLFTEENQQDDECIVFGGDTYVTPMRYVNSTFWDNRIARRAGKSSLLKKILGAVLAVIGAALLIFTGGASTLIIGAGIALIGAGALFANAGIKTDNFNRAYNEEYDKGLRQTTLDSWVDAFYNYRNNAYTQLFGFVGNGGTGHDGPSDDSIQWIGDCITDLWFETSVNTSLRVGMISDTPTFLNAPGRIESGNNGPISTWEYFGLNYSNDGPERYPISSLERHLSRKLLAFDAERNDNRYYIGLALGEYYKINPDYQREEREKIYTHLALEYDCCSECQEDFPHRIHYSEQSFQEELSDNFRVFLPNNYRDIPGETGEITNIFKIGNNLYIHTFEGLWQLPRNYQERVTDQIVSFIGTGDYFAVPPQKIIDDETGNTAGLQHKWSAIKTPQGYFFVCENQRKVYQFNGKNLLPISANGLDNWFKENTELQVDRNYYQSTNERYTYRDNPSNPIGSGFISTYDTRKERVIFTKKDFQFDSGIIDSNDFEICYSNGGQLVLFEDFNQTIQDEATQGWIYIGLEDCRMKFERITTEIVQEEREIVSEFPNTADIWVMLDMSGSFDNNDRQDIINAVNDWQANFASANPDWTGNLYIYQHPNTAESEDYIRCLEFITAQPQYAGVNLNTLDIVVVSFVNENGDPGFGHTYHAQDLVATLDGPYTDYVQDRANFINFYNQLNSFFGILYPIVRSGTGTVAGWSRGFLQHSLAAITGTSYTAAEANAIPVNPGFTTAQWNTLLTSLQGVNPYNDDGLENYGWVGQWNRTGDANGNVIDSQTFQDDINLLLQGITVVETILVDVLVENREVKYIDGIQIEDPIQFSNSWTISYALEQTDRQASWVSWHSYLPNFYIHVPEKFYSWIYGNDGLWQHNKKYHYQTYYGQLYPHIVEYNSLSNPLNTRIWNYLTLLTEAKRFDSKFNEYVDERFITFNKAILHNTRQCSGLLNLKVKDLGVNVDYLNEQIVNNSDVIIDRNERDWTINDFRDIRIDYTQPIWDSTLASLQNEYYIDKILNELSLDENKDWTQLESFRDKYLMIRLIFDTFANIKLITNYSVENEVQSSR